MSLAKHPLWRKPQHHLDTDHSSDHVHWLELFYDLVHVVAIFVLGNYLSHHLSVTGFMVFAALFIIIWFAWFDISLFNSLYVSTDIQHRYIMAAQIITMMLMSAAIVHIDGGGWAFFAVGYALNRAIIALLYWRARFVGDSQVQLPTEMTRNFLIAAGLFLVSAFLPKPYNYLLFSVTLLGLLSMYVLPKIGALRNERFLPRLGHMAERFALLLLIVAGEGFFKLVITLAEKGVDEVPADIFVNYVIGGSAIFVLCWIYFDFAGNGKPRDTEKRTLVQWTLAHLLLMLSAVCIGVALSAEVKVSFMDSYPTKYAVLGCVGLAVYLYCLLLIQNVIELRAAHDFATAKVRAFGIVLALITLVAVPFVPSFVANILWGGALFSQIIIPVTRAYLHFSKLAQQ